MVVITIKTTIKTTIIIILVVVVVSNSDGNGNNARGGGARAGGGHVLRGAAGGGGGGAGGVGRGDGAQLLLLTFNFFSTSSSNIASWVRTLTGDGAQFLLRVRHPGHCRAPPSLPFWLIHCVAVGFTCCVARLRFIVGRLGAAPIMLRMTRAV